MTKITDYLLAMRPQLAMFLVEVLIGVLIGVNFNLFRIDYLFLLLALVSFQVMYYGIYIVNDIIDYKYDKNSPRKQQRPIASGRLPRMNAFLFSLLLFIIAFAISTQISLKLVYFEIFFIIYVLIYSFVLKRIPYVDTASGAVTHTMRIVMGIALFGVFTQYYFAIFLIFLFSATISIKRLKEIKYKEKVKRPIQYYSERGIIAYWIIVIPIGIILYYFSSVIEGDIILVILSVYALAILFYSRSAKVKRIFEKIAD